MGNKNKDIDLIIKSFDAELSECERRELDNYLADDANRKKYELMKEVHLKALETGRQITPDTAAGWKAFINRLRTGSHGLSRPWRVAVIASCAAAVACVSVLLFRELQGEATRMPSMDEYVAAAGKMPELRDTRLVFSDGKSIDIDSRCAEIIISGNGSYSINSVTIESPANEGYNRLIVPQRHWVHLVLPDGSRVELNSSTDFIFPSAFSGKERPVHVCGEGYFAVAKDASRPFTVSTEGMKVSVLGTEFNMKSRDNLSEVTLVQGKVNVTSDGGKSCILSPSEQVRLENGELGDTRVVDTETVTGWTKPRMVCRDQDIEQVVEKLSSYYDVEFHYTESLKDIVINGKIDLREELESVLNTIEFTAPVSFEREGGKVEVHRTDNFRKRGK